MKLCRGHTRKGSLPLVGLYLVGWVIYLIGFALYANEITVRTGAESFPFWAFLFGGLFLFACCLIHLLIGRWYSGVVTHFLLCICLVVGGAVIYADAIVLFPNGQVTRGITDRAGRLYMLVEWVGATFSLIFMTLFVMMWPLFPDNRYD